MELIAVPVHHWEFDEVEFSEHFRSPIVKDVGKSAQEQQLFNGILRAVLLGKRDKNSLETKMALSVETSHDRPCSETEDGVVELLGTDSSFVQFDHRVLDVGESDFSIAFGMRTSDTRRFDVMGNRTYGSHGNFLSIRMNTAGDVHVELDENTQGKNYVSILSSRKGLHDGSWHHYVVVRRNYTLALFIDGKLDVSLLSKGIARLHPNGNSAFKIGLSVYGYTNLVTPRAQFMDLRVYDVALSPKQVEQIHNRFVPCHSLTQLSCWKVVNSLKQRSTSSRLQQGGAPLLEQLRFLLPDELYELCLWYYY